MQHNFSGYGNSFLQTFWGLKEIECVFNCMSDIKFFYQVFSVDNAGN